MFYSVAKLIIPFIAKPCPYKFLLSSFAMGLFVTSLSKASPVKVGSVQIIDTTSSDFNDPDKAALEHLTADEVRVAAKSEGEAVRAINGIQRDAHPHTDSSDTIVIFIPHSESENWNILTGSSPQSNEKPNDSSGTITIKIFRVADGRFNEINTSLKAAHKLETANSLMPEPWDFKSAARKTAIKGAFLIPMLVFMSADLHFKLAFFFIDTMETYLTTIGRKGFDDKLFERSWSLPLKRLIKIKNPRTHQEYSDEDVATWRKAVNNIGADGKQSAKRIVYRGFYMSAVLGAINNYEFFSASDILTNLMIFSGFYLANSVRSRLNKTRIQDTKADYTLDFLIWLSVPVAYFDLLTNSLAKNIDWIDHNSWMFAKLFELNLKIPFTEIALAAEFRPLTIAAVASLYAAALMIYVAPEKLMKLANFREWRGEWREKAKPRGKSSFHPHTFAAALTARPGAPHSTKQTEAERARRQPFANSSDHHGSWPSLPEPRSPSKNLCASLF